MALEFWGLLLVVLGLIAWVWLAGSQRMREMERRAAMYRHPAGSDDHSLSVFERLPLYDHEARGDFE